MDRISIPDSSEPLVIRKATEEDALGIAQVHYDAVTHTAAADYDQKILADWTKSPTPERIEQFKSTIREQKEIMFVAVRGGVVGFGSLYPQNSELRAVYVSPQAGRQGVGALLLAKLEQTAQASGLEELWLDSSLTAEKFYQKHGWIVEERGTHTLRSGLKMACVKMKKKL